VNSAWWGVALGALTGVGMLLIGLRIAAIRRPTLAGRVLPYARDLSGALARVGRPSGGVLDPESARHSATRGVFGPVLRSAADATDRILGGTTSVRQRLARAGLNLTVHDFRVQQVLWGLSGFAAAAALALVEASRDPSGALGSLMLCGAAFVVGVLARENHLTAQARARERRILTELPTVAELLALAVAAGEGPVAALDRVVLRTRGDLSRDLARVLASIRTGETVANAFDRMAAEAGLPAVARFAQGIAVAVERGTPLSDVLHAQAADVREAGRRELIEIAARKEVAMMLPVVFLVLPITVLFAFWPGLVGLSLTTP